MNRRRIRKKRTFFFAMIAVIIFISGVFTVKEQNMFAGALDGQYCGNSVEIFLKEKEAATEYNIEVENKNVSGGETVQMDENLMKKPLVMIQNRGGKVIEDKIIRNGVKFKK